MDNCFQFLPVHIPTVLPHPNDLLVSLTKDEHVSSVHITNPLTPDTIPNNTKASAALNAINHLHTSFTSPFGTPDVTLDHPTWLCMIIETLARIHEGFCNVQLISPDKDLPKSFRHLSPNKLNTVARIFEIMSWINDFCEAAEDDHVAPF
jgi:hypothetical protein